MASTALCNIMALYTLLIVQILQGAETKNVRKLMSRANHVN